MYKYVIISLLLSMNIALALESIDYKTGYIAGREDAVGEPIWFYGGLLTGPLGLGASFILSPDKPENVNTLYSDEYLNGYYDGYKYETEIKNTHFASTGFLISFLIIFILTN